MNIMDKDNQNPQGNMELEEVQPGVDEHQNDSMNFMPYPDDMFDVYPLGLACMQAQMNTMIQVLNQLTQNMAQMVQLTTMQVQNQMPQLAPEFQPPLPQELPPTPPPLPIESVPLAHVVQGNNGNNSQNVTQMLAVVGAQLAQLSFFGGG